MAASLLFSSFPCVLPSRNGPCLPHALATPPPHPLLHRPRDFSIFAAPEASDPLPSPSAQPPPRHHHRHQKPLRSSSSSYAAAAAAAASPLVSIIPPLAASLLLFSAFCPPGEAGIFSGSPGLTSFDLPSLPTPDILKKIQEENKIKYEGLDEKFKSSSLVQELLKRSKQNAEQHKREIQDKYCQRGADWGVGDCSTAAMSEEERNAFMETLKGKQSAE